MQTNHFSSLNIKPALLKNLHDLGYKSMTPIQAKALPVVLDKRDVIAQAKTGSGKTLAFGLALLESLNVKHFGVQALVLCPTRELAEQVAKSLRSLARQIPNVKVLNLSGGLAFGPQIGSLKHGAHIVVGTPGRVLKHLNKGFFKPEHLKTLVLDEADRMLDMGFLEEIEAILEKLPSKRQNLFFSATFEDNILNFAKSMVEDGIEIRIEEEKHLIKQEFFVSQRKQEALSALLRFSQAKRTLVFVNTKQGAQELSDYLQEEGFFALALHGDLEQFDRTETLVQFSNESATILLATDVAARGLDIEALELVINYDLPRTLETYVHRIGRTGRAGKEGLAYSLLASNEMHKLLELQEHFQTELPCAHSLPTTEKNIVKPAFATLAIEGGKKQKLRAGDILGALVKDAGLEANDVGKIDIFDFDAYVAIKEKSFLKAFKHLRRHKIKGRDFRVFSLRRED